MMRILLDLMGGPGLFLAVLLLLVRLAPNQPAQPSTSVRRGRNLTLENACQPQTAGRGPTPPGMR